MGTLISHSHNIRVRSIQRRQVINVRSKKRRTLPNQLTSSYREFHKQTKINRFMQVFGIIIVIIGIVISATYINQNNIAEEIAQDQIATALEQGSDDGNPDTPQPSVIVPTTNDKPSRSEVLTHKTPADQPKRIEIYNIDVFARVNPVGINTKGEVGVPVSVYDASWFNQSSIVGQNPGSSVIVGHVGFRSIEGVFSKINELKSGDVIKVVMGDDREFKYRVVENRNIKLDDFSMSNYLSYNNQSSAMLHLITCTGSILRGSTAYDSRLVVSGELLQ